MEFLLTEWWIIAHNASPKRMVGCKTASDFGKENRPRSSYTEVFRQMIIPNLLSQHRSDFLQISLVGTGRLASVSRFRNLYAENKLSIGASRIMASGTSNMYLSFGVLEISRIGRR